MSQDTPPKLPPSSYFLLALIISLLFGGFTMEPANSGEEYTIAMAFAIGISAWLMNSVLFGVALWKRPLFLFSFFCLTMGNLVGLTVIDLVNGQPALSSILGFLIGAALTFASYLFCVKLQKRTKTTS